MASAVVEVVSDSISTPFPASGCLMLSATKFFFSVIATCHAETFLTFSLFAADVMISKDRSVSNTWSSSARGPARAFSAERTVFRFQMSLRWQRHIIWCSLQNTTVSRTPFSAYLWKEPRQQFPFNPWGQWYWFYSVVAMVCCSGKRQFVDVPKACGAKKKQGNNLTIGGGWGRK